MSCQETNLLTWIECHPGTAAWVQAIGAIVALAVAIFVPVWMARRADRLSRERFLVFRRIQKIHRSVGVCDTGIMAWGDGGHGSDGMRGCRRCGPPAAGIDRRRPQSAAEARRAGAHRARLGGSGVDAARGAKRRRQPADGVAVAATLCRS